MSMGDEIFRALTGGLDPGRDGFGAMLHTIREQYPSRRAAARATGIPETTLRRWDTQGIGSKAQEANRGRLVNAYRLSLMNAATAARWRANGMTMNVAGVPGRGGGNRSLTARTLGLQAGTGDKVVAAFLAGDDAGAAQAFVAGIGDHWYRTVMFGEWMDDPDLGDNDSDYAVSVGGAS